jgi:hypothetical protein
VKVTQIGLFDKEEVSYEVEHKTTVRIGRHSAPVPLRRRRREATDKLKQLLGLLERKDILVSSYWGPHNHFCAEGLLLRCLQVEWGLAWLSKGLPNVLVLWGSETARGGQQSVRIFLEQLHAVREQYYQNGKPYYLIDFWNGWGEYPIDKYRPTGYVSLQIEAAR